MLSGNEKKSIMPKNVLGEIISTSFYCSVVKPPYLGTLPMGNGHRAKCHHGIPIVVATSALVKLFLICQMHHRFKFRLTPTNGNTDITQLISKGCRKCLKEEAFLLVVYQLSSCTFISWWQAKRQFHGEGYASFFFCRTACCLRWKNASPNWLRRKVHATRTVDTCFSPTR